jgi:hypothetical protein
MKKYPKSDVLAERINSFSQSYVGWDSTKASKDNALSILGKASDQFWVIDKNKRSNAVFHHYDYSNIDTNVSGRPGLTKSDFYHFRPGIAPPGPRDYKAIIQSCGDAYLHVGLVRNIIDLMGDFACQGVRIAHRNKKVEKFYKNWFARVNGIERSERFCNNLFRSGNIIIRKAYAKVVPKLEKTMYQSVASDIKPNILEPKDKEIPWQYTFLEPTTVDVVGGALAAFVGHPIYTLNIPSYLRTIISGPKTAEEKEIVNQLPVDIINAARTSKPYVLPADKTRVFHYKKDDWQLFAYPILYAVLDDIQMLEQLRLADMAALDGAISNLRIFKLGSLEHKIVPSPAIAAKLASILQSNTGAGTIDLIWGPDIELLESKTEVHKFLGEEKYRPHLSAVYTGLGIPSIFTGGGGTGTTNNFMALKTLIQRLKYARSILLQFWNYEIAEVQKAMGFRFPAKLEFDLDILDDENAVRALLIQLVDRNLISDELLQERFGHDSEMEGIRINREQSERDKGNRPSKAGPFYDPLFGIALKKVALQTGVITPGQVGLNKDAKIDSLILYDKNKGETPAMEMKVKQAAKPGDNSTPVKPTGIPQQGRPKNSKDSQKRKTKVFKPKVKAQLEVWAHSAQDIISEIINPIFLEEIAKKKNLRQLTNVEANQLEKIKFGVLFNIEPISQIQPDIVYQSLGQEVDVDLYQTYQIWLSALGTELNRPLTMDETKQVQVALYIENQQNNDE